jgi:hypothetical protein
MNASPVLDLALSLWPQVRDQGTVNNPSDLDTLLATQGQPGAPGQEEGVVHTFACFRPDDEAMFTLATGERPQSDAEARMIASILVTRTLLGAGLHVDRRVQQAMAQTYAVTWAVRGGYDASPLTLASTLWLIALDPHRSSDRPLPIDWDAPLYQDPERWDLDYRLFSHYDMRERALDWVMYASVSPGRHAGCSTWTIIEPLLRVNDGRAHLALAQLSESAEQEQESAPAAAMLERARIESMLRAFLAQLAPNRPGRD